MEVSRSGFSEWRNAPESATAKKRGILALYVKKSFEDPGEHGAGTVPDPVPASRAAGDRERLPEAVTAAVLEFCEPALAVNPHR